MAGNRGMYFSDDEIFDELEKMGYNDVSSDVFQMMKHDLTDLVSGEKSYRGKLNRSPIHSPKYRSRLSTPEDEIPEDTSLHDINPNVGYLDDNRYIQRKLYRKTREEPTSYVDDISYASERFPSIRSQIPDSQYYTEDSSFARPSRTQLSNQKRLTRPQLSDNVENFSSSELRKESYLSNRSLSKRQLFVVDETKVSHDESDNELIPENKFFSNYKNSYQNYKTNKQTSLPSIKGDSVSSLETHLSSMTIDGKLKRKVLRHKDGKPVVTEESIDIPCIFNSSYPETSFNTPRSFTHDVSFKSNSSTGSIVALSPEMTPRSTVSLPPATKFRNNSRRKKSDPVQMYNYYKKYWDNYKPPGEKNHHKIRWAVRDRMLDYSL